MTREGGCLCGAIRYTAELSKTTFGACHCAMCRHWTGGPLLTTQAQVTWTTGSPKTFQSSQWAERGFCADCGSCLFYRISAHDDDHPIHLAVGTLDDLSGFDMTHEVYVDHRPDAWRFEGDRKQMTEADVMALYAPS